MKQWKYCPQCGCDEIVNKNLVREGYRECKCCGQEWWLDVDYTDTVKLVLQRLNKKSSDVFPEILQHSLDNQIKEASISFCTWYSKLSIVDKVTLHNPYGQDEVSGGIYTKPIEKLYKDFLNEEAKKAQLSEPNVEK